MLTSKSGKTINYPIEKEYLNKLVSLIKQTPTFRNKSAYNYRMNLIQLKML